MFVYGLITAELILLYTVFWYLYLRDPNPSRRIVADNWGNYEAAAITTRGATMTAYEYQSILESKQCKVKELSQERADYIKPFMVPVYSELTLDVRTNRYVPLEPKQGFVAQFFDDMNGQLSCLNVKS